MEPHLPKVSDLMLGKHPPVPSSWYPIPIERRSMIPLSWKTSGAKSGVELGYSALISLIRQQF